VRQLAYVDGVTGIFNRRYFELRIAEEVARSRRHSLVFSVIMVDIDHFKQLNDEFGHLLGDEVLRQVSGILQQQLRKSDVLSRYGGEEFAIITPETSGESALAVADKLRRMVESWHFPGVPRRVTVSAGVADFPAQGAHATSWSRPPMRRFMRPNRTDATVCSPPRCFAASDSLAPQAVQLQNPKVLCRFPAQGCPNGYLRELHIRGAQSTMKPD